MDQPFEASMGQDSKSWHFSHSLSQKTSSSRRLHPIGTSVDPSSSRRYCSHCETYMEPQYRAGGVCEVCRKRGQEYVSSIRTQINKPPGLWERQSDTGSALPKFTPLQPRHVARSQRPPVRKVYTQCASCMATVGTSDRPVDSVVLCGACRSRSQPSRSSPLPQSHSHNPPYYTNRQLSQTPARSIPPASTNPMFESPPIMQHFNSRGELIVPQTQLQIPNASGPSVVRTHEPRYRNPYPTTLRMCKSMSCGRPLLRDHRGAFCTRCATRSSSPMEPPYNTYRRSDSLLSSSESNYDVLELNKMTNDRIASKNDTNVTPSILEDDIEDEMDFDLQYPEAPPTANMQKTSSGSAQAKEQKSLTTRVPSQPHNDHEPPFELMVGSIGFAGLVLEEPLDTLQTKKKQLQRACETKSCTGLVPPDSNWQRCMDCSVKRWKTRESRAVAAGDDGSKSKKGAKGSSTSARIETGHIESDAEPNLRDEIMETMEVMTVLADMVPASETPAGDASRKTPELSEDANATHPSSPTTSKYSSTCGETSRASISGWDSDLTDLSSSEDEGESEIDVDSDVPYEKPRRRQKSPRGAGQGTGSGLKIRLPVLASSQSGDPKSPIRVCGIKRCHIVLPSDYRWKICEACRRHNRDYQRQRLGLIRERAATATACPPLHPGSRDHSTSRTLISDDSLSRAESLTTYGSPSIMDTVAESTPSREKEEASIIAELMSGHSIPTSQTRLEDVPSQFEPSSQTVTVSPNIPSTTPSNVANARFCIMRRCNAKLPPSIEYPWKTCEACLARTRLDARKRKEALYQTLGSRKDGKDQTPDRATSSGAVESSLPDTKPNSPFPVFQHISALSTAITTRFERFMEAQILYLHVKLQTAKSKMINVNPVAFAFDGEYSTVIGNKCDIEGEQKGSEARIVNMRQDACNIVRELSEALGTVFNPMGSFSNESGGIVMRFSCAVVVNVPLPFDQSKHNDTLHDPDAVKNTEQNDDSDVFVKRMAGELEVTVHPDDTHQLFVGQRYVIQFRLIG